MTVLVTGAAGFVGQALVRRLVGDGEPPGTKRDDFFVDLWAANWL